MIISVSRHSISMMDSAIGSPSIAMGRNGSKLSGRACRVRLSPEEFVHQRTTSMTALRSNDPAILNKRKVGCFLLNLYEKRFEQGAECEVSL